MAENQDLRGPLVQLARLSLTGQHADLVAFVKRLSRRQSKKDPELASELKALVDQAPASSTRAISAGEAIPVDTDSRLELLRRESPVILRHSPVLSPGLLEGLVATIQERGHERELAVAGLSPTKSLLFTGPPGVGKTLAARWLACELGLPLLTLDLSAVMSSFLGRTGNNLRTVLDYAQRGPCVLLLDEFDACAKRRDDATEIGELKRLVTVLLQAVDDWPATGLLVAATNHPELLDPAVWRRFDRVVAFDLPGLEELSLAIRTFLPAGEGPAEDWIPVLAAAFSGMSYSDVERDLAMVRRRALIGGTSLDSELQRHVSRLLAGRSREERLEVALRLREQGLSQRVAARVAGVSRDTLRKHRAE